MGEGFGQRAGSTFEEASQTRDYCVAKSATHRAARPDPSLRKKRLLGMTQKSIQPAIIWRRSSRRILRR